MNHRHYYMIGFAAVALILVAAIMFNPTSDFSGTDDGGSDVIEEIDPNYEPWFQSIWEPSGELATLFFCLQSAIGSLIIGYFIGINRQRNVSVQNGNKGA